MSCSKENNNNNSNNNDLNLFEEIEYTVKSSNDDMSKNANSNIVSSTFDIEINNINDVEDINEALIHKTLAHINNYNKQHDLKLMTIKFFDKLKAKIISNSGTINSKSSSLLYQVFQIILRDQDKYLNKISNNSKTLLLLKTVASKYGVLGELMKEKSHQFLKNLYQENSMYMIESSKEKNEILSLPLGEDSNSKNNSNEKEKENIYDSSLIYIDDCNKADEEEIEYLINKELKNIIKMKMNKQDNNCVISNISDNIKKEEEHTNTNTTNNTALLGSQLLKDLDFSSKSDSNKNHKDADKGEFEKTLEEENLNKLKLKYEYTKTNQNNLLLLKEFGLIKLQNSISLNETLLKQLSQENETVKNEIILLNKKRRFNQLTALEEISLIDNNIEKAYKRIEEYSNKIFELKTEVKKYQIAKSH